MPWGCGCMHWGLCVAGAPSRGVQLAQQLLARQLACCLLAAANRQAVAASDTGLSHTAHAGGLW